VLTLFIGALLEERCKAVEGLVIPVEERRLKIEKRLK